MIKQREPFCKGGSFCFYVLGRNGRTDCVRLTSCRFHAKLIRNLNSKDIIMLDPIFC
ncbi:hypothetical protein CHK_1807 [Christensenella hongkongensis]|uniref:Uncharacterized protein n=1 Tax=Christensenella hongkongensis TaxID=270498 RepID=A0A0M2NJS7_9FIRM|nr:hypothetical protein CHK_1807 [Christensenella hongkongensis]